MTDRWAWRLLLMQLIMLLAGTQMPGAWRAAIEAGMHAPSGFSSMAHLVLFLGMAWLAAARPLSWPWQRVVLAALTLALLTEGLQFFAIERHPRWLDVGIDLGGVALGLALSWASGKRGTSCMRP